MLERRSEARARKLLYAIRVRVGWNIEAALHFSKRAYVVGVVVREKDTLECSAFLLQVLQESPKASLLEGVDGRRVDDVEALFPHDAGIRVGRRGLRWRLERHEKNPR